MGQREEGKNYADFVAETLFGKVRSTVRYINPPLVRSLAQRIVFCLEANVVDHIHLFSYVCIPGLTRLLVHAGLQL